MKVQALSIEMWDINKILPNPDNPNRHDHEQIEMLASVFLYQGFRNPLIISRQTGLLVTGHCRLQAALYLGVSKLPVMVQDFEDEAMEFAHVTADNTTAEWATLDVSKVNEKFIEFGPDFDIDMLGMKNFSIEPMEKERRKESEIDVDSMAFENVCPKCNYEW